MAVPWLDVVGDLPSLLGSRMKRRPRVWVARRGYGDETQGAPIVGTVGPAGPLRLPHASENPLAMVCRGTPSTASCKHDPLTSTWPRRTIAATQGKTIRGPDPALCRTGRSQRIPLQGLGG